MKIKLNNRIKTFGQLDIGDPFYIGISQRKVLLMKILTHLNGTNAVDLSDGRTVSYKDTTEVISANVIIVENSTKDDDHED